LRWLAEFKPKETTATFLDARMRDKGVTNRELFPERMT